MLKDSNKYYPIDYASIHDVPDDTIIEHADMTIKAQMNDPFAQLVRI
jgi:hypothetical protein